MPLWTRDLHRLLGNYEFGNERRNANTHKRQFFELIMETDTLQLIKSPAAHREQLFVTFINGLGLIQTLPSRYVLLGKLRDWFEPRGHVMAAATDCLLLTHFAHMMRGERCAIGADKLHGFALHALAKELENPNVANEDGVLAATDALGIRQLYSERPCEQHVHGLCSLLRARGTEPSRYMTGLSKDLLFGALHVALMFALSSRTRLVFGEPRWMHTLESNCSGRVWCLFHLAFSVPAALEKVDKITYTSTEEVATLLNQLIELEHRFQIWLLMWYEEFPDSPITSTSVTNFRDFVARHGPIAETFPSSYVFHSFTMALGHITYWTMILPLREAIFDLAISPKHPLSRRRIITSMLSQLSTSVLTQFAARCRS